MVTRWKREPVTKSIFVVGVGVGVGVGVSVGVGVGVVSGSRPGARRAGGVTCLRSESARGCLHSGFPLLYDHIL